MAENSKISWTHHTFNHIRGCTKVAAGCQFCYADAQSKRNPGVLGIWGPDGTRVIASEDMWKQPLKWDRKVKAAGERHRVFCASLADVFEDWDGEVHDSQGCAHYTSDDGRDMQPNAAFIGGTTDGYHYTTLNDVRARLFRLIDATPNLDWLLLTKRPENIRRMLPYVSQTVLQEQSYQFSRYRRNVWFGTSVAEQIDADRNIPPLLQCGDLSPVLFLSIEPMIAEIDIRKFIDPNMDQHGNHRPSWVIVGGESGPHARPCHVDWIRSIVRQCRDAGVPCFVKQLGDDAWIDPQELSDMRASPGYKPLKADKGGDPDEWPEDLRVREFPAVTMK